MDTHTGRLTLTLVVASALGVLNAGSAAAADGAETDQSASKVRQFTCLNMSLQCFAVTTPAKPSASRLDLRAPDIRRLVPEAELSKPILDPYELRERETVVEVEGTRPEVYVPGGIASLPWAVMHPTQAWRILLPVPSSQAK